MRKFYAEVRKRNGKLCTKSSLVRKRVGLQQFFSSHKIDIIKDPEFSGANAVYQAEISELKRKEKLTHYTNHHQQRWHKETVYTTFIMADGARDW